MSGPNTLKRFPNQGLQPTRFPGDAKVTNIRFAERSITIPQGQIMYETSTRGVWASYALGGAGKSAPTYSSGSPGGSGGGLNLSILKYAVTLDANQNITNLDEWGGAEQCCEAYIAGYFSVLDLVDLDEDAVIAWNARIVSGTLAGPGEILIPG